MELVTVCMVITVIMGPLIFCPIKLMDGYILPQIAVTAIGISIATIAFSRIGLFPVSFVSILALFYLFYLFLTQFWSTVPHNSLRDLPLVFSYLTGFIICSVLFTNISNLIWISVGICFVGTLIATYGILQRFRIDPVFKERLVSEKKLYGEKKREEIPKWFRNKNFVDTRPIGTIGNTTFFAGYLSATLPFIIFLSLKVSPWFFIGFGVVLIAIAMSECRAAYLGVIIGGIVFLILMAQKGLVFDFFGWVWEFTAVKVSFGMLLLLLIGGIVHFVVWFRRSNIGKRLSNNEDPLCNMLDMENVDQEDFIAHLRYRFRYWRTGLELIRQKPLFGFGLRTYRKEVYQAQARLHDKDGKFLGPCYHMPKPRECHNDYLENFVEGGIIGGALFLLIMGIVVNHTRIFLNTVPNMGEYILVASILSAFICISVNAFFFFPLRLGPSSLLFFLGLVMLESLTSYTSVISYTPSWIITILLIGVLASLLWEGSIKPNLGNMHFTKYMFSNDSVIKEDSLVKAMDYCPKETMFLDRAIMGYSAFFPEIAEKFADRMLLFYDGMTPAWTMYYNVGATKLINKRFESAAKLFQDSAYYYPRFKTPLKQLAAIWPLIPNPKRRTIVKQMGQERIYAIQSMQKEIEKCQLMMENLILQEKVEMSIPLNWGFDIQKYQFLTPEEAEKLRIEMEKKRGEQQNNQT